MVYPNSFRPPAARSVVALVLMLGALHVPAQTLNVPSSIVTRDVPAIAASVGARLARYANVRSAAHAAWQGDGMLIYTRFADSTQVHRVAEPLGYREQVTFLKEPVAGVFAPAGGATDKVILMWNEGGSEFNQLFLYDLTTRRSRRLSDGKSLYSRVVWSADEQQIAYVTTARNGRNWDIHLQDMDGNIRRLFETDEGYWYPLDWSADGKQLLIKHRVSINESSIHVIEIASGEVRPLIGNEQRMSVAHAQFDGSGGVIYTSDADGEFLRLLHRKAGAAESEVLTPDLQWDVEDFVLSADRDRLAFSVNVNGISRVQVRTLAQNRPMRLPSIPAGVVRSMSFSPDGEQLAISLNRASAPSDVYGIDLRRRTLARWTRSELGGLDPQAMVEAELVSYPTFDDREIPAFLYRPEGEGPHPVVVMIHGGPEGQYRPTFSTTIQSYVNEMGVAVIAPNVRGSAGYGKTYLQLDNGYLREDSVRDIGALLDWIAEQPQLDESSVAVMGGSYGGYMVLASATHFADRLSAAVESVGISNFVTFLENTQAYRQDMRRVEYGDERDPKMRQFLQSISPLNRVQRIRTPMLISQGANDPRVPASESEQIKQALDAAGVPAWYILATNEGHGFRKKVNRDYDQAAKFTFLETYLRTEKE